MGQAKTLRRLPTKDEIYKVFNRLWVQWPTDPLRPKRSIRALTPMKPDNPNFDQRHTFYQSAAMKVLLQNKLREHVHFVCGVC